MKIKYPRTFHLPWSEAFTWDDKRLSDAKCFEGKSVVVTEKMDGENTTMSREYIHARSLDSRDHDSRSWVKQLHGSMRNDIPHGWRICGENLYAQHSVHYDTLSTYFMVFSIWNEHNVCLSWDDTVLWATMMGLQTVPVIGRWYQFDENVIRAISIDTNVQEGYVLRNDATFHYDDFKDNVAKYVRKNHVQTDKHWSTQWSPNSLA